MKTYELFIQGKQVLLDDAGLAVLKSDGPWVVLNGYLCLGSKHPVSPGKAIHRLIAGAAPDQHVDHINGVRLDNRSINLRLCTHAENMRNRKMHKSNTSGFPGVYRRGDTWTAEIKFKGKRFRTRSYATASEAFEARKSIERDLMDPFRSEHKPPSPPRSTLVSLGDLREFAPRAARELAPKGTDIVFTVERWPETASRHYRLCAAFTDKHGIRWEPATVQMTVNDFGDLVY